LQDRWATGRSCGGHGVKSLFLTFGPDFQGEIFRVLKEKDVNELRGDGMLEEAQILFGKRRGNHYYQLI
jgi:hypothetical protein